MKSIYPILDFSSNALAVTQRHKEIDNWVHFSLAFCQTRGSELATGKLKWWIIEMMRLQREVETGEVWQMGRKCEDKWTRNHNSV